MTEIIVFPDVEALLCDWLPAQLAAHRAVAVPVSTRVPSPRPGEFVRVLRTGGVRGGVLILDNPTVTLEAWAQTETAAEALIQLVRGLVNSLPGQMVDGTTFYRVAEFSGPGNLPDPESAQIRYTYSASILLRGSALPTV